ncbi:arylsulfatase A-like enzyme [Sinorhizobium medicae]|uniref:sulfatase n=1 Tax=Sinorhizobium medicae TaxID=110321 RepID=UPI00119F75CC|nr:sulfatase [Sinorhizobium medicae]TWA49878.1 arylsulfatase A-like enzyme [Sinorhizobium medicae]
MRAIFVLFDSLNRTAVGRYGANAVKTPNFDRFAERATTFDSHFVGSLPCMPARRDLHTGRLNFMHRSWGPLEPFDNSFPELLGKCGVHSHLITDHLHYFEDGGSTYHTRFRTWDFIRGQEDDPWKAMVQPPLERFKEMYSEKHYDFDDPWKRMQSAVNREFVRGEHEYPGPRCFKSALEFLDLNRAADDWFLMVECFDPHEPFAAPERFKEQYATGWEGGVLDWPKYEKVVDSPEEIAEIRANYAALVTMCDEYFGRLLDYFDEHDLWKDTAIILSTDHGFLLAEHDWWGKNRMPYYAEISQIPLIIYHPEHAGGGGTRRSALTQTIDLMPTFLDLFGIDVPQEVQGHSLLPLLKEDRSMRDVAIFGVFGGPIGSTDGRYTYYLYPEDLYGPDLHEYTLMPMHLTSLFTPEELKTSALTAGFNFTKNMPVLRIDALRDARRIPNNDRVGWSVDLGTTLYDLHLDRTQMRPFRDSEIELRLSEGIRSVLIAHDAPEEYYRRYGLAAMDVGS